MDPKQPLSYSRLGPMDPRQGRYELAEELAAPVPPDGEATGRPRRERLRRLRRRRGRE